LAQFDVTALLSSSALNANKIKRLSWNYSMYSSIAGFLIFMQVAKRFRFNDIYMKAVSHGQAL
jgi:hypothetical protein